MAQGRFRQGRYQQGIGVPESLGVQPTTWTEPKEPKLFRATWTSPNAGVSRNYGSTPSYVDTVPHRWNYGDGSGKFIKGLANQIAKSKTSTTPTDPFSTVPSPETGVSVPPPPSSASRAVSVRPLDIPPMEEQGADFLTASARVASDEPFTPNVEWRDEPDNPFPQGSRTPFNRKRMYDPTYLPESQQATSSANSRTQNRRPKRI